MQAQGRFAGHPLYFRARGAAWTRTPCTNADIAPAVLAASDREGFFRDGDREGFQLRGDHDSDFEAGFMPHAEAERLIRACAARFLAADHPG